ncbi:recombination regulator RecX [Streptomyces sp. NPDC048324]|uniref:recombination regulator RecX n=1 Tax=Streptomyces sp. NPDC048324 TaxID=3157205 RepID=UPI003430BD47
MTRRTDWAEYTHPDAPRGRGGRDDGGFAGPGGEADGEGTRQDAGGGHGRAGAYGTGSSYGSRNSSDGDGPYGGGPYGDDPYGDGRYGDGNGNGSYGGEWPGEGSAGSGHAGHDAAPADGGPRRRGGRTSGAGGSRGRRGRRGGEPFGEDGGSSSLSRAEREEPPADPVERARAICLRLLTGTPRTRKQLADALRKREIPDEAAEEVLSRFEEVGLINDSAFADAWVESRHHGRGLARRALAQELRTKGVNSELIDVAVAQLDSEQEEETARELVARKLRSTRGLDRDKRLRRLAGMLARKGYSQGMALRVVRQALEEEGEDTEFLGDEGY